MDPFQCTDCISGYKDSHYNDESVVHETDLFFMGIHVRGETTIMYLLKS